MKHLKIIVDHKDAWSPYYNFDSLITVERYLQNIDKESSYIINLSERMAYLEHGFYASLLAKANNDTIIPTVTTLNDIQHFENTDLLKITGKMSFNEINNIAKDGVLSFKILFGETNIKALEKK